MTERDRAMVWACAALAALPAVVAGVVSIRSGWVPSSDYGPIELRVRDVFSTHPPLVGPFTRIGGNHPGPAMYYVLAVPYHLLGRQPWALMAGAAAVNAVALALTVRIAGRGGRVPAAALMAGLALVCAASLTADQLRDPWNPRLAVFPFLLACVATWATACGSRRCLPVAAVAASFCLQSHVGYALLVAVLGLWCLAGPVLDRANLRAWLTPVLVAGGLTALMWAPPLLEQVLADGGNLRRVVTGAGAGEDEVRMGLGQAGRFLLPHLGPTPAWFRVTATDVFALGGRSGLTMPPLGLLAGLASVVVAVVRRRRDEVVLVGLLVSLSAAATVSMSLITGPPFVYLYHWVWVLGILLWWTAGLVLGRAAGDAIRARRPVRVPARVPAIAATAVLTCVSLVVAVGAGRPPFRTYQAKYAAAASFAQATGQAVDEREGSGLVIELLWSGPLHFVTPAVVADLERRGHHVLVEPGSDSVYGPGRAWGDEQPDLRVVIATEERIRPEGGTLVAEVVDVVPDSPVPGGLPGYAWIVDGAG